MCNVLSRIALLDFALFALLRCILDRSGKKKNARLRNARYAQRVHQRYVSRRTHACVKIISRGGFGRLNSYEISHFRILGILTCFSISASLVIPTKWGECGSLQFPFLYPHREKSSRNAELPFLFHTLSNTRVEDVGRTGQSATQVLPTGVIPHASRTRRAGSYKSNKKRGRGKRIK